MTNKTSRRGIALLCATVLAVAACGSDDDSAEESSDTATSDTEASDTSSPGDDPADESADDSGDESAGEGLGDPNPATGEPFEVFYMWSGVSPTIDNSSDLAAAQATAEWVNEYGGGIGVDGRELVLRECGTDEDAAIAAACGSEIVDSGVPIVLFNVNGTMEPWATPTLEAGIPLFAYGSADPSVMAWPDLVSTMSNPIAGLATAPAEVALAVGAENTTISVIDVPAASGPAQQLAPPTFEGRQAGEVSILPISPSATDHSADIQTELQVGNPDLVHIVGNPAYCTLSIQALRNAGFEGAISAISNCFDEPSLEQLGSDVEGIYATYSANEDPENPDYQRFLAIVDEYDPEITPRGTPTGAYVVIEAFRRFMEDYDGDYSSDSINQHIKGHDPVPVVGAADSSYVCDGEQVAGIPISCTAVGFYSQLGADGNPTTFVPTK